MEPVLTDSDDDIPPLVSSSEEEDDMSVAVLTDSDGDIPPLVTDTESNDGDEPAHLFASNAKTSTDSGDLSESEDDALASNAKTFLEVFSGTGALSRAIGYHGFTTLTLDIENGDGEDMASADTLQRVKELVCDGNMGYCHVAPPCNTFSTARLPKLRSKANPCGKKGLSSKTKRLVRQANKVTNNATDVMKTCCEMHVPVSVENPKGSLFWQYPRWVHLQQQFQFETVQVDYCQYGAAYRKRTLIKTYHGGQPSFLVALAASCPGTSSSHAHSVNLSGWRPLRHMEHPMERTRVRSAAYPDRLVRAWARCVVALLE